MQILECIVKERGSTIPYTTLRSRPPGYEDKIPQEIAGNWLVEKCAEYVKIYDLSKYSFEICWREWIPSARQIDLD